RGRLRDPASVGGARPNRPTLRKAPSESSLRVEDKARLAEGVALTRRLFQQLNALSAVPVHPAKLLSAVLGRLPDGRREEIAGGAGCGAARADDDLHREHGAGGAR